MTPQTETGEMASRDERRIERIVRKAERAFERGNYAAVRRTQIQLAHEMGWV